MGNLAADGERDRQLFINLRITLMPKPEIKFSIKKDNFVYHIGLLKDDEQVQCVWLTTEDGEGGAFDLDKFSDTIFDAIDKFFRDNM